MQVRVEDLPLSEALDLDRLRLLDLDDHLGAREDLIRGVHELRSGRLVLGIRERGTLPRTSLDEDRVPVGDEFLHTARSHGDAELVVLYLLRYTDDHVHSSRSLGCVRLCSCIA